MYAQAHTSTYADTYLCVYICAYIIYRMVPDPFPETTGCTGVKLPASPKTNKTLLKIQLTSLGQVYTTAPNACWTGPFHPSVSSLRSNQRSRGSVAAFLAVEFICLTPLQRVRAAGPGWKGFSRADSSASLTGEGQPWSEEWGGGDVGTIPQGIAAAPRLLAVPQTPSWGAPSPRPALPARKRFRLKSLCPIETSL